MRTSAIALVSILALPSARAELELGGRVQADVRARLEEKAVGEFYQRLRLPVGVERNENILKLTLNASAERFRGVADVDLVWLGRAPDIEAIGDLSDRSLIDPVRLEAHALYLEATDLFVDGLDLRLGQQIVSWGVGDQFNPTNNLNADDLEDVLLFGTQQANLMAKLDYSLEDLFSISAVLVPIFKPAQLPRSGALSVAAIDRLPMLDAAVRHRIHVEQAMSNGGLTETFPTVVGEVRPVLPEDSFENMQYAVRFATTLLEQDVSVSFYEGRTDFPVPVQNDTRQTVARQCDPNDSARCADGILTTDVILAYPKMRVIGLNLAGELDALGWLGDEVSPLGWRLELGVFLPRAQTLSIRQTDITIGGTTVPGGEYDYRGAGPPLVVDDRPFAKWVLGVDYSFDEHFYVNLQWVHGLVDEYGAGDFLQEGYAVRQGGVLGGSDVPSCFINRTYGECAREILRPRLGDYLVVGLDIRFDHGAGLLRLFNILDLTGFVEERYSRAEGRRTSTALSPFSAEGFSAILYPELSYNFGNGLELALGALVQLGKDYSKFGDPAAGGSLLWTRGRFSF